MIEPNYDIFFRGETLENFEVDAVKQAMAQLFKASPEKMDQLFSGKVVALKKDLDKPTAAKFKQVLEKAGAKIYIKAAATASATISSTPINSTETSPAKNITPPIKEEAIQEELIILPPGSDVLTDAEKTIITPVHIDTSGIKLASAFEQPVIDQTPLPKAPDVSHLSTAAVGADMLEGVIKPAIPPAPNVDHFSIAAAGADLTEGVQKTPIPNAPDVSHLSTAAVGSDMLEGIAKKPIPEAPNVSHIKLSE